MCPLLGTWPTTQASIPDWELSWQPFGLQAGTQATESLQPGHFSWFYHGCSILCRQCTLLMPASRAECSRCPALPFLSHCQTCPYRSHLISGNNTNDFPGGSPILMQREFHQTSSTSAQTCPDMLCSLRKITTNLYKGQESTTRPFKHCGIV